MTANDRMANPERFSATRKLNHRISADVDAVVDQAMALARNQRFASAEEMRLALMGQTIASRKKLPLWVWAVAVVLLIGGVAGGVLGLSRPAKPAASTSTPLATLMPTVTAKPSPTPRPTASPTPRPSSTPQPSSTPKSATATPASTVERSTAVPTAVDAAVPLLLEPGAGTSLGTGVTFSWQGGLGASQAFVVYLRHLESGHTQQSPPLTANTWAAALPADRFGEWRWRVRVVHNGALLLQSEERHFWLSPFPGGGDDDDDTPSPGVSPLSIPAPPSG